VIKLLIKTNIFILIFFIGIAIQALPNEANDSILNVVNSYIKKSQPDAAIPVILDLIENCNSKDILIRANIYLAESYRQKDENKKGIDLIHHTIKKYHLSVNDLAFAYNRMAALYNEWDNKNVQGKDSAIYYSEQCMKLAELAGDINLLATSQNEVAYAYRIKHDLPKALEYAQKAYNNFNKIGLYQYAINVAINLSGTYIALNQYDKALEVNKEAFLLSSEEENYNLYMRLYLNKSHIYQMMEDYKNAFEAMRKARNMQSKFYEDRIQLQINEMSAKYDLQIKELQIKEIETSNKVANQQKKYLTIILIITVLTFLIALITINLKRRNRIQKEKLTEQQNLQLKLTLETKEKELTYKNRELTKAISNSIAMNETLKSIKSVLNPNENRNAIDVINSNLNNNLNWEKFKISFNEIYPQFLNHLTEKYPSLTQNEKRLCAFLRMGMRTSEIANLINISETSVSKNRNRLRKKLGLKSGFDISLFLKEMI
jgi:DNA-binding CsgD family transcriptional regulator/tetratricopeptide (TPR) repeat protein